MTPASDFDRMVMEFMEDDPLTAIYLSYNDGVYNPTLGENVTAVTEVEVDAILLDLTLQSNGLSTKFGTLVLGGDKNLYIRPPEKKDIEAEALVINPSKDRVRIGTVEYKIVTMKEINPSGSNPILYDLYIRR